LKIRRTLPPTAAPLSLLDLLHGICGMANGKAAEKFEREIKEYFGTKHVFLLSSGKASLALILLGLKSASARKKVIIPAYTCYSVPSSIIKAGLEIVPCDIKTDTLDFNHGELEKLVDDDTLCIVATHLFGIPADIARLKEITRGAGVYLVEDAAQAMGVTWEQAKLGMLGDVSFLSLGRGKNITCGSGGIILTSSDEIAGKIQRQYEKLEREPVIEYARIIAEVFLMIFFLHPCLYWIPDGLPFLKIGETKFFPTFSICRLNRFKAGLAHNWKKKLEKYNEIRTNISDYYMEKMDLQGKMPMYSKKVPYLRFPVYGNSREMKNRICRQYRVLGMSSMYPDSVNNIKEIRDGFMKGKYRNAELVAEKLLTLPTHILLREMDKIKICDILSDA